METDSSPASATLVLVCGLPGTGKTTIAQAIALRLNATHINTDRVRTVMGLLGHYSAEDKERVYAEMYRQARAALRKEGMVVLDGTFAAGEERARVQELAGETEADVHWIEVRAAEEAVRERVSVKRPFTEADYEVYRLVRDRWQPLDEIHLVLWTDRDTLDDLTEQAIRWLQVHRPGMHQGMGREDIEALRGCLPFPSELVETHISWVILGPERVYKIRKPVRYAFLDFSTPAKREADCHKELRLNRRFSPEVYLAVVPVRRLGEYWSLGDGNGEEMDHAVLMQRLDTQRQMDVLLRAGRVDESAMVSLADTLAAFHTVAERQRVGQDAHALWLDFADILKVEPSIREHLGERCASELQASAALARTIIRGLDGRLDQRMSEGFVRDGHGDLHTRNIFLLERPVLFDCLEFNDHLRQVDLLSEIAFLGMDLHAFGRDDLWEVFLERYRQRLQVIQVPEDGSLLDWFLWYRANVRLKVQALRAMQDPQAVGEGLTSAWKVYLHFARRCGYISEHPASVHSVKNT